MLLMVMFATKWMFTGPEVTNAYISHKGQFKTKEFLKQSKTKMDTATDKPEHPTHQQPLCFPTDSDKAFCLQL